MSLFDSIISSAGDKFGLGNKSGTLLSALLSLMTDQNRGGFAGFLDSFSKAGLGDLATSWISSGSNDDLTEDQVEAALGSETITEIANQADLNASTAKSALAYMIPNVVDQLTPDGVVPEEKDLLTKIGDFLSGIGGAVAGAALGAAGAVGAVASGAADKVGDAAGAAADVVGDAAGATVDAGKAVVGKGVEVVGKGADMVGDAASGALNAVGDVFDGDGDSGGILKWLLPLILLALALLVGYWFCSKPNVKPAAPAANANKAANADAAKVVESSFKIVAKDGKYVVTGVVQDQKTLDEIKAKLDAQFGAGNVDYSGMKVDATAKPFGAGWWDNFGKMLPNLKDWKNGSLAFAGSAITEAIGLPAAALDQLKSLFSGWKLPDFGAATTDAPRTLAEVSLPDGTKLQAYPGGIEDQLIKFIQSDDYKNGTAETLKDKWFSFDDLNFKFGTTELVPESKRQLDNIVAILKAFPAVKMKIGGYTDKKGDDAANKKLSDTRAKAVKAALEAAGVGAQVPEAEGYGEEFAKVAETASDKEREADRKTAVRLIK
jgi:outer membrane protein OmpA-like peptidoglycan-associated protein/uncharacterized protein YidB (DUF937 family)